MYDIHIKYQDIKLTFWPSMHGLYSLSRRTSYRKILWILEAARFGFRLFHRSEIWQAPRQQRGRDACHISERYNHHNTQSRVFETSRDLAVRRLTGWWIEGPCTTAVHLRWRDDLISHPYDTSISYKGVDESSVWASKYVLVYCYYNTDHLSSNPHWMTKICHMEELTSHPYDLDTLYPYIAAISHGRLTQPIT